MSDIGVGDRVLCIDDSDLMEPSKPPPRLGRIYTIADMGVFFGKTFVALEELDGVVDWYLRRFRKCRPTSIEIFRQIAAKPHEKILEDA